MPTDRPDQPDPEYRVEYVANGRANKVWDPPGAVTRTWYDTAGRPIARAPDPDGPPDPSEPITTTACSDTPGTRAGDAERNAPPGTVTRTTYDPADPPRPLSVWYFTYDATGRLLYDGPTPMPDPDEPPDEPFVVG